MKKLVFGIILGSLASLGVLTINPQPAEAAGETLSSVDPIIESKGQATWYGFACEGVGEIRCLKRL